MVAVAVESMGVSLGLPLAVVGQAVGSGSHIGGGVSGVDGNSESKAVRLGAPLVQLADMLEGMATGMKLVHGITGSEMAQAMDVVVEESDGNTVRLCAPLSVVGQAVGGGSNIGGGASRVDGNSKTVAVRLGAPLAVVRQAPGSGSHIGGGVPGVDANSKTVAVGLRQAGGHKAGGEDLHKGGNKQKIWHSFNGFN